MTLNGRIAIITGSGRGLGRAMALGLAQAGARVAVNDVDADVMQETVEAIRSRHGKDAAAGIALDLTAPGAPQALVDQTVATLGGVHIVINNAGIGPQAGNPNFLAAPRKFWEIPPELFRLTFAVNTELPYQMTRAVVHRLLAQGWGRIINVTTSLDTMLRVGTAPYGGSKAANEAHTAILAADLEGTGVTVNVLVPGGPANTRMIPMESLMKREELIQPDVMITPLVWLCSDAANGIHGKRFIAARWDTAKPGHLAADGCSAPIGWPQLAGAIYPGGMK